MATYILLMTLLPAGQEKALANPEFMLDVESAITVDGVTTLGCYAVLGSYDFVTIVEAEDNRAVALFSIEMGVRAGVHVTTLPAVPVGNLEPRQEQELPMNLTDVQISPEAIVEESMGPA